MPRQSKFSYISFTAGEYEYQYIVEWEEASVNKRAINKKRPDIKIRTKVGLTKIMRVHKRDYDVFQALDMDSHAVSSRKIRSLGHKKKQNIVETRDMDSLTFEDVGYAQNVPNYSNKAYLSRSPPIIPPHLLHFLLNKKPIRKACTECPEILPKPCHTLLNHLYARSLNEEGVMTLSSTQRYRKKFVTTIFYSPISDPY